ncbi:MAG TPA: Hpt domain-containing protein [Marinilabiliaceae bacterium]|nr:Hpt domain-containing protein [Marinilabiliaceae bacterium]
MLQEIKKQFFEQTLHELTSISELLDKDKFEEKEMSVLIDRIFNITHQICGTAPMLGYEAMPVLSRKLERVFYQMRTEKTEITNQFIQQTKRNLIVMISLLNDET